MWLPDAENKPTSQRRTALITGASRGIGLAIARKFAQQGCNLIITGRDEKSLQKVSRELLRLKIRVLAVRCDVRDPHSVDTLFRSIRREFPRLDILVNNAGIAHPNLPYRQATVSQCGKMFSKPMWMACSW